MSDHLLPADLHVRHWFVLFVRSNQEKIIAHRLADREIEYLLPCYRSLRQWKDRRVTLERPLFPGYLFVRLPFEERSKVLTIPNVVCLVGKRSSPSVVSDEEINWIKCGMKYGNAMPHSYLAIGEPVRVVAGALAGMEGILLRKQNSTRVVISLDAIMRSFVVEVDLDSIEPVTAPPYRYREAV
ncbi:MAG TPA: UpxY family transcription antiterminator [Candidatus Angelobacter sp.]|nr:UpxY family transcription antiterminator [Candidatus Angelobacter sp.]